MSYQKIYLDPMFSKQPYEKRLLEYKRRISSIQSRKVKQNATNRDKLVEALATRTVESYLDIIPLKFTLHKTSKKTPKIEQSLTPKKETTTKPTPEPLNFQRQFTVPSTSPRLKKFRLKTSNVLLAMAAVVFLLGVGVALLGLRTNSAVEAQVKNTASSSSNSNAPSEDVPALGSYNVAPNMPRYIIIPSLNVKGRVVKVGVNAKNELQAPKNIHDGGWYESSAKPGDIAGAMLIDGHVLGPTKSAIFSKLNLLITGDLIQVERGDGKVFSFKVVKSKTFDADKVDMASTVVSADVAKLGLNLITCAGSFNARTDSYNQRLVVYAVAQ